MMISWDHLGSADCAFQHEVRTFYEENLTVELREAGRKTMWAISEFEYGRAWQKILHAKGWGAVNWPQEHGGPGWTPQQHLIWAVETMRHRPPSIMNMGRDLCAPCIMKFGTSQQKAQYLPRILSGEDWWAQGYSEPGAGSDLAALQLSAVRDGEHFVLNGSKIWTTFAQHANRMFCLVRTRREEKKQAGITFLLIDLPTDGIEIRPILNLAGQHEFNEVFFTDARVPVSGLLGEEGQGWTVARHLLSFEHSGSLFSGLELRRRLEWLETLAREEPDGMGGCLFDNADFQQRFLDLAIQCEASDAITLRMLTLAAEDGVPPGMAELINIRRRELGQNLTEALMLAVGPYASIFQRDVLRVGGQAIGGPERRALATAFFLSQRAATIAGGTTEIHRNNVAKHVLGL